ncbi:MAG: DEAD/DEAH box helicase [Patescibacteria group bacterium]
MEVKSRKSSITLRENQAPHFKRLVDIITNNHTWMDGSSMGTGKTWITGALAINFQMPLHVICPKNVASVWTSMAAAVGLDLFVYTYDSFRGTRTKQPSCGLLERRDIQITNAKGNISLVPQFFSTQLLRDIIDKGAFFIFDEAHKLKHKSTQFLAGQIIAKMILSSPKGISRVGLLSGTMYDKKKCVIQFLKLMGYIFDEDLKFNFGEVVEVSNVYNRKETSKILDSDVGLLDIIYKLYIGVILPRILSVADAPKLTVNVRNGFFHMDISSVKQMLEAMNDLINKAKFQLEAFNRALMKIEIAKLPTLVRLAKDKLKESPDCKVVLFVNYKSSIEFLKTEMAEYNPLIYFGGVKSSVREEAIKKFQEPTNEFRLLILTIQSGSVGISLHDTDGRFPRYVFGIPRFSAIDMQQATYRVFRDGMKSPAYVTYVYDIRTGEIELSIQRALAEKSKILKDQVLNKTDVTYPDEYEIYKEPKIVERKSKIIVKE